MSLWFSLHTPNETRCPHCAGAVFVGSPHEVYSRNITHNLGAMASKAGIYNCLWRPEENDFKYAAEIIPALEKGLADLIARPEYFAQFNAANGWGMYKHFVPFVREILDACKEYPHAEISANR